MQVSSASTGLGPGVFALPSAHSHGGEGGNAGKEAEDVCPCQEESKRLTGDTPDLQAQ